MDNIRKHLPFRQPSSGSAGNAGNADQSRSVFHMPLTNTPKMDIQQCRLGLAQYIATWNNFCGAGSHLSQLYKDILKDSEYAPVAGQLEERLGEMEHVTGNVSAQVKAELDKMLIALDAKLDRANLTPELTQEKEQVSFHVKGQMHHHDHDDLGLKCVYSCHLSNKTTRKSVLLSTQIWLMKVSKKQA